MLLILKEERVIVVMACSPHRFAEIVIVVMACSPHRFAEIVIVVIACSPQRFPHCYCLSGSLHGSGYVRSGPGA